VEERDVEVRNEHGLHARPAAAFVQTAARYTSRITLRNLSRDGAEVDAKSIMMVLTAGVHKGARVRIRAEGEDAADAVQALVDLVESGLGEQGFS